MEYPNISICMPIYNRNKFIKLILSNILKLDYDFNKLEFIIDDDGDVENVDQWGDIQDIIKPIKYKYLKYKNKRSIGVKRNNLVKQASNKIIAFMDSDDLYLSNYLKHSIDILKKGNYGLVGSRQMLFLYPKLNWKLTAIQCMEKRMAHEATFVFTKKYWKASGGFQKSSKGEGVGMIDYMNKNKIGMTNIDECMICICHDNNTVNKSRFIESEEIKGALISDYDKNLILNSLN